MSGLTLLARRGGAASAKLLQRSSRQPIVAQSKNNLWNLGGYATAQPGGQTTFQRVVQGTVVCLAFAFWLIDTQTVRHEWHKYKHGDGHSQITSMFTPQHGIEMGPKPAGRVSRYE